MAETDESAPLPVPLPGSMPDRLPEGAPAPDFDPRAVAKALLRATRSGTLATIDRNTGHPFASLVNVATDVDGAPLILISRLATHTANLERDGRASVLLASAGKGDPLAHPRLTLIGVFAPVRGGDAQGPRSRVRRRFLARHPEIGALCRLRRLRRSGALTSCRLTSMLALPALPTSRPNRR